MGLGGHTSIGFSGGIIVLWSRSIGLVTPSQSTDMLFISWSLLIIILGSLLLSIIPSFFRIIKFFGILLQIKTLNNLFDLGFSSSSFTWYNAQNGLARRWAKLDRFLANFQWLLSFKDYSNYHLPHTNSNYSPLFLNAKNSPKFLNKIFHFDNVWFNHEGCHDSVVRAWSDVTFNTPMHSFMHLFPILKKHSQVEKERLLSHWCRTYEYSGRD